MHDDFSPLPGPCSQLRFLQVTQSEALVHLRLHRPDKRNAISDAFLAELQIAFSALPAHCRAVVLSGAGEHFCAGLDLSEVMERSVADGVLHSRAWHQAFEQIQYGRVPVIAALHGAVIGGGLELAATAHLRVADRSTFYGLPEGQRGIFVGGGGSVRLPRLAGFSLMTDMMLTGRVLDAAEGQAAGLSNYLVEPGAAVDKAIELARKVASNAPLSNFAILQALPRIADMSRSDGLFVEALMSAVAQGDDEAKARVRAFLEKRAGKVGREA
ncbi:crotonase/enoyl-CoA hydratase family protein [Variovorax boronicumulans]|uniref:crotonase/enoyl-CoA hydratase family protein n=1 Tax=Variovorax boronicumulans TaxID=436515 RepID=UPI001C564659